MLLGIEDLSGLMAEQWVGAKAPFECLMLPKEEVYPITEAGVAARLGLIHKPTDVVRFAEALHRETNPITAQEPDSISVYMNKERLSG